METVQGSAPMRSRLIPGVTTSSPIARIATSLTAIVGLIISFAVVSVTGSRPLGGIALAMTATACGIAWFAITGPVRAIMSLVLIGVAFIASHPLSDYVGAWPAVIASAGVAGALTYALARPAR